jgi:hypothetical protein
VAEVAKQKSILSSGVTSSAGRQEKISDAVGEANELLQSTIPVNQPSVGWSPVLWCATACIALGSVLLLWRNRRMTS